MKTAAPGRRVSPVVVVVAILAVAVGALVFALQRTGGDDPTPGGGGGQTARTWVSPPYSIKLPSGWARVCKEAATRCAGQPVSAGVRRSAFTRGAGESFLRLTVDRTPERSLGESATLASSAEAVEAQLRSLPGYRRVGRVPESNRLGPHRVREIAFTSRDKGSAAGVATVLLMDGDLYVMTGLGSEVASVRRVTESATASLREVR